MKGPACILAGALLASPLFGATCPALTPKDLPALAEARGGSVHLIFFSSWCAGCREHLTGKHDAHTVLVGSFDKRERIEQVMAALNPDAPCFFDDGVAGALGVASLPKKMTWSPKGGLKARLD